MSAYAEHCEFCIRQRNSWDLEHCISLYVSLPFMCSYCIHLLGHAKDMGREQHSCIQISFFPGFGSFWSEVLLSIRFLGLLGWPRTKRFMMNREGTDMSVRMLSVF